MIPYTCLTLAEPDPRRLAAAMQRFAGETAYIEVRLDFLERPEVPAPPASETRFLATCRPVREGGRFGGSEEERLRVLRSAAQAGYAWIDLEADVPADLSEFRPARVLRSHHDFAGVGRGLRQEWERLRSTPGDGYKLAVMPGGAAEVDHLFALLRAVPAEPPRVLLGMGIAAQPTRWWGPWLGNAWTYVVAGEDAAVAPGQFTLEEARFLYAGRESPPELYLVLGRRPSCQEGTVVRLNEELRKRSVPGACLWWSVSAAAGDPRSALERWGLPVRGLNCDFWGEEASAADAPPDGIAAAATELPGVRVWEEAFLETLRRAGGPAVRAAFVLGAGRTARRAANALSAAGCRVWLDSRLPEPAGSWRGDAGVVAGPAVLVTFAGARALGTLLRASSPEWRSAVQVWLDLSGEGAALEELRDWFPCLQGWAGAGEFRESFVRRTVAAWLGEGPRRG
ncbi:MAG: hypothetical protein Kow00109_15240 [Acidobacteriota bacterium]